MTGFGSNTFNKSQFNKTSSQSGLSASGVGGGGGTANLFLEQNISGSGVGSGTGTGSLVKAKQLSAYGSGQGAGTASLEKLKALSASGQGVGTGSKASLFIEQSMSASGVGTGTGSAVLDQLLNMSASGTGVGSGSGSVFMQSFLSASGNGVGVGNAIVEASIGNWNGFDDGKVVERTQNSVQAKAQKWLIDASKDQFYKARFKAFEEISPDLSTALGTSSGSFTQGTFAIHMQIDDTSILRDADTLQLKIGSSPNDYAVWTIDRSELGPDGEYKYLTFSHDEYDSITGTPDWTNTDFFEITMFETFGNTTDTFIYVDYLTVSDRDDVGATGIGDRRSDKKQIRSGD